MRNSTRRWYEFIFPVVGVAVMLAGLAMLVITHDEASGYSFLTVGAVMFGTSGLGSRRRGKSRAANCLR